MFGNPLYQQLHTKIVRYIAPYDAAVRSVLARPGDQRSSAPPKPQHEQVLVAFYHSEYTPHEAAQRGHLPARRAEIREALPQRQAVPVLGRGQPRQRTRRVLEPLGGAGRPLLPGAAPRVQGLHGHRPRRARRAAHRRHAELHLGIQAGDPPPGDGHAEDLGPAQLLGRQPPGRLAHARTRTRLRRPGVAHRDRRDRAVRRGLPEQARLGSDAGGEGAQVHVRARRLRAPDQAHVHLRLERRHQPDALRCRADERPRTSRAPATSSCAASCTRPTAP